jgi:hypothetical protein
MKAKLLLRIAAVFALLFFAGHMSGMPWTPALEPAQQAVIDAMKSQTFDTMGQTRSYWSFYQGFGLTLDVFLLLQAVLLWQLAGLAAVDWRRARPMAASFLAASVLGAGVAWQYIFIIPVVCNLLVALCLLLALLTGKAEGAPAGRA